MKQSMSLHIIVTKNVYVSVFSRGGVGNIQQRVTQAATQAAANAAVNELMDAFKMKL